MGLKEQLMEDMKTAMKNKESGRLDAIRLLRASIQRLEVDRPDRKNPNYGQPITETDYIGVVQKEIKQPIPPNLPGEPPNYQGCSQPPLKE